MISFAIHSQYSLASRPYLLSSFSQPLVIPQPTAIWLQPSSLSNVTRSSVTILFLNPRDSSQSLNCWICLTDVTIWPLKNTRSLCFHEALFLQPHWLLFLYSLFLCLLHEYWRCPRLSSRPSALLTLHTPPISQYRLGSACHLHADILEILSLCLQAWVWAPCIPLSSIYSFNQ